MSHRTALSIAAALGGFLALAAPAPAAMSVPEFSVTVDRPAGEATFTIDFPHAPDFIHTDGHGHPVDSFQFQIATDSKANLALNPTTVIRGDEIRFFNAIAIRNGSPPSSDPNSGGYGSVRGTVPFTLKGNDLTFTAPLSTLDAPGGNFSYLAITTHDGATQAQAESRSVPLPPALVSGLMMLGLGMTIAIGKSMLGSKSARVF